MRSQTTLAVSLLGFFLVSLEVLIINVALARIGRDLGGGTVGQQWVVDGYTLMFASFLLFAGTLSDRLGAKRAFGIGIVLFVVASAACGVAPGIGALIAARFAHGAAAAVMLPASMALIREAYPDTRRRARAIGIWAMGGALAGIIGPFIGGLVATIDWRLVFAINLPVGVVMLFLLARVARSAVHPARFDWPGQVTAIIGLGALMYGLIEGGNRGFGSPAVILTLVVAVAGIGSFLVMQARGSHPMMPLQLFRARSMRIAMSIGFAFVVGWFGVAFVLSLFLQQHLGLSPLIAGLAFLPPAIPSALGNLASGPVTARFGPRPLAFLGQALMVAGLVAMLVTVPLGSVALVAILLVPIGVGGSLAMPAVTALVLDGVPVDRAGTASAAFNTFRQVGGAVAIAVFGALIAHPASFVSGVQISLLIAASLLLATTVASLFIRRVQHD